MAPPDPGEDARPPFARTIVHVPILPSTSDKAKRLLAEGRTPLPLIVRADRQTAGRGRGRNAWWSDEGSLTFTVGIDPSRFSLGIAHEPRVALATAVALIDTIEALGRSDGRLGIRWPNDIEADGRKLGGILPERVETPGGIRLAIGIGLNVTTRLDDAPSSVSSTATSLERLGRSIAADALLPRICERIWSVLSALGQDDPSLAARWSDLDILRGQPVRIDQGGPILAGTGRGIDPEGALHVETPRGDMAIVRGGRVLRP